MLLVVLGWQWAGRPIPVTPDAPTDRFNSLSFAPYRPGESPLTGHYPTEAEIDSDLALLAPKVNAIRTYASAEGIVDVPGLAKQHGIKVWEGIWLSGDRARNQIEIAAGVAQANRYPGTIDRVVVGNEVLLRRDLPPAELIGDIDEVRSQVSQPVTYADVQDFWEEFPEVARHVDIVTVHLLPYWENNPTDIDGAVAHIDAVYQHMHQLFPGKPIAIGETGWPSRGRWRDAAAPSIVNEAKFIREFMVLAAREGFQYNLIEAFDQNWKAIGEGTVGSRWGIWTADRRPKFPLRGPVSNDPDWPNAAALSVGCALLLIMVGFSGPKLPLRVAALLSCCATILGTSVGYGVSETWPDLYTLDLGLAASVNLPVQELLAALAVRRFRSVLLGHRPRRSRNGNDATNFARALVLMQWPRVSLDALFDDLNFIFVWVALMLEILLVLDGRYRDFPTPAFVTPVAVVVLRAVLADLPCSGGGREEIWLGLSLVGFAVFNIFEETLANTQAMVWDGMALTMALAQLLRLVRFQAKGGKNLLFVNKKKQKNLGNLGLEVSAPIE